MNAGPAVHAERGASDRALTELSVSGMTCSNCARHVTDALQRVPGVRSATVDLAGHKASIRWTAGAAPDVRALIHSVEAEGYEAKAQSDGEPCSCHHEDHAEHTLAGWQLNLWIGVLGTAPLMIGEWALHLGHTAWFRWISFAIASVVQIIAGAPFYRGAWSQLKRGRSNMDTLVALGSTTAFGYSAWALL